MPKNISAKKKKNKTYTPQQIAFGMYYYLPDSKTFGNAMQSAIKAGFGQEYSKSITAKNLKWVEEIVSEIVGSGVSKEKLVKKAKMILNKSLESEDEKIAQDTAKFIAKTTPEFSERQELNVNSELNVAVVEFLNEGKDTDTKRI